MKKAALILVLSFAVNIAYLHAEGESDLVLHGKASFQTYCARCHGTEAKGDGIDAKRVPVQPRNLVDEKIKFKSTVSGTAPSDRDILWILNHGMSGAGMPSFANLNADVKASLVAYIKTLSPNFTEYKPEPITPPNTNAKVNLKKGAEVFDNMKCALCHGETGRANGTSAFTLTDAQKRSIRPANLTQGWTYRAGNSPVDIYTRLMAGIDGTPMPSYDGAITPDDAWQLANYVASMQLKPNWSSKLHVKKVSVDLPTTDDDTLWDTADRVDINMQNNFYKDGRRERTVVNAISVQAISNGKETVFRLAWNDQTMNSKIPADAVMIAFKPKDFQGQPLDNLYTLYRPDAPPLELYSWTADDPQRVRHATSNVDAATRGAAKFSQELRSDAKYTNGLWTMIFSAPVSVEENDQLAFGCLAWDGSVNDSKLDRSASKWIYLVSGESTDHH